MIDYAPPELAADDGAAAAARRRDVVPGLLRAGHRQQPRRAGLPGRPAPTTAGGSPARRCGRAWPSTPQRCVLLDPHRARPSRPTAASPRCSSTWTRPASPCGRSRRCTARQEFCEVFFDDVAVPFDRTLGDEGQGWAVAMDLLPFERSTALWHRGAFLHRRLEQLLGRRARRRARRRPRSARSFQQLYAFRARSRATQHRLAAGERLGPETSIDKILLATAEQAVFDLVADGLRRRRAARRRRRPASGGAPSSSTPGPPRSTAAAPRSSATSSPAACSTSGADR